MQLVIAGDAPLPSPTTNARTRANQAVILAATRKYQPTRALQDSQRESHRRRQQDDSAELAAHAKTNIGKGCR